MDDIDKYIPVSRELFNRIQSLIGGIEVDLDFDAPLPAEEVSEEEYRAALVEGEQLLALPVTQVNRLRMERICNLIEAYEAQFTDFAINPTTFRNEEPA